MAKHLSLSERAFIERALVHEKSFAEIAKQLNRSATTISREVKSHRVFVQRFRDDKNDCIQATENQADTDQNGIQIPSWQNLRGI